MDSRLHVHQPGLQIRSIFLDTKEQKAVAIVDQRFKPRVLLRDYLLPDNVAPTVVEMGFVKDATHGLLAKVLCQPQRKKHELQQWGKGANGNLCKDKVPNRHLIFFRLYTHMP